VQVRRAAEGISKLARGTETLAAHASGEASGFGEYLSSGADRLHSAAERIYGLADEVEAGELEAVLDDVRDFARRKPAVFLTAAALAGFGIGRLVRATKDSEDDDAELETTPARQPRRVTAGRPAVAADADAVRTERGIAL